MTATHWMPVDVSNDEWPDNPKSTPEAAAEMFLCEVGRSNDDCWEAWDELEKMGECTIELRGFIQTKELIEDPNERFEGYEPGCEWFKANDEKRKVVVTLQYKAQEASK